MPDTFAQVFPASGMFAAGGTVTKNGSALAGVRATSMGIKPVLSAAGPVATSSFYVSDLSPVVWRDLDFDKTQSLTIDATATWSRSDWAIAFACNEDQNASMLFGITEAFGGIKARIWGDTFTTSAGAGSGPYTMPGDGTLTTGDRVKLRLVIAPRAGVAGDWTFTYSIRRENSGGTQVYDYTTIATGNISDFSSGFVIPSGVPLRIGWKVGGDALTSCSVTSFVATGTATVNTPNPATNITVAFMGDSILTAAQRPSTGGNTLCGRVGTVLSPLVGKTTARVIGGGISAMTTALGAQRVAGSNEFNYPAVDELLAQVGIYTQDVLIYALGINDAINAVSGTTSKTNATTTLNLFPTQPIVVCVPSYVKSTYSNAATVNAAVDVLATKYAEIVASINAVTPGRAVLCNLRTLDVNGASGTWDGLHWGVNPTLVAAGATLIANAAQSVMIPATATLTPASATLTLEPSSTRRVSVVARDSGGATITSATVTASSSDADVTLGASATTVAGGIATFDVAANSSTTAGDTATLTFTSSGITATVAVSIIAQLGAGGVSRRRPARGRG